MSCMHAVISTMQGKKGHGRGGKGRKRGRKGEEGPSTESPGPIPVPLIGQPAAE